MRGLKIAVLVMGIMLVVGFAALIAAVALRLSHNGRSTGPPGAFTAPPLELSPGAHIAAISTGSDRLVIEVVLPDGNHQLIILDLATGRRLGVIPVHVGP